MHDNVGEGLRVLRKSACDSLVVLHGSQQGGCGEDSGALSP